MAGDSGEIRYLHTIDTFDNIYISYNSKLVVPVMLTLYRYVFGDNMYVS